MTRRDYAPSIKPPGVWPNTAISPEHLGFCMIKTAVADLVLITVSLIATWWYRQDTKPTPPALRTASVERSDLLFMIDATGTVEPEEVGTSAEVAGKVQNLGVDPRDPECTIHYGSPVSVGPRSAIDDSLYQSDVNRQKPRSTPQKRSRIHRRSSCRIAGECRTSRKRLVANAIQALSGRSRLGTRSGPVEVVAKRHSRVRL